MTDPGRVTLVVKVAHTEFETVTIDVDRVPGLDGEDLVHEHQDAIGALLPEHWGDNWDLLTVEVRE